MKLIFVTASLNSGGAERVISLLANEMVGRGHEVNICLLNKKTVFYTLDPKVRLSFFGDQAMVKRFGKFRRHVKEEKPDCVIAFMTLVFCFTLFSLIGTGQKVITSERIDPKFTPSIVKLLRRLLLPLTDRHVVQTSVIKSYYPKKIQRKTNIIFNPVNDKVFELEQVQKEDVLISVGRLMDQKNYRMLIDAFFNISTEFPTYKLKIFGDGELHETLQRQIDDLKLGGRALLMGKSNNIPDELNKAKVFCFTSNFEGMSNSMIEALCCGLPIVTTKVSGTEELIAEGENGYVTPTGDLETYTHTLRALLRDEEKMNEIAENNRLKAPMFKTAVVVNQWEKLIEAVIEEK